MALSCQPFDPAFSAQARWSQSIGIRTYGSKRKPTRRAAFCLLPLMCPAQTRSFQSSGKHKSWTVA
eukprot:15478744-Alexandrium_andersonii.AAC.1